MSRCLAILAAVAALLAGPSPTLAWNNAGHRITAAIAYRQLDEATRKRVADLLRAHPAYTTLWTGHPHDGTDPDLNLFMNAALFPDEARRGGPFESYNRSAAHYVNYRIMADQGNKVLDPIPGENVLHSYRANVQTVADPGNKAGDRAVALSWIFHQAGDIHQPLHAVARFGKATPQGDRGGNEVGFPGLGPVPPSPRYRPNLHGYWDGLLGLNEAPEFIEAQARELTAEFPRDQFAAELARTEIGDWALESVDLALAQVYRDLDPAIKTFAEVPIGYQADARRAARRRAALAGYRLADQLARLFPGS